MIINVAANNHAKETLNMQFLDHIQQYIMQPSLLIQYFTANLSLLIFGPLVLAFIVFAFHLVSLVWRKCGNILKLSGSEAIKCIFGAIKNGTSDDIGDMLKLNIGEAALSIFGAIRNGTKGGWVTPLTSIGGMLGILVLLQTSTLFTDLSALFGIILLLAPLVSKVLEWNKYLASLGNALSTILTLWAVLGELSAAMIFQASLNLTNPLITIAFRIVVFLCIGLVLVYLAECIIVNTFIKKTSATKEQAALTDSIVLSIEAHSAPELSR